MTEAQKALVVPETKAVGLLAGCLNVPDVIDNEDDAKGATEMVKQLRLCRKRIDADRKEITDGLDDSKARLMAKAKVFTVPLKQWEDAVGDRLTNYQVKQKRLADAAEAKAKQEAAERALEAAQDLEEAGDADGSQEALELAVDIPAPAPTSDSRIRSEVGAGSSLQSYWQPDFGNVDKEKIPREYLMVDEAKVKAVVKAGVRDIPGIPIREVHQSRVS